MHTPKVLSHTRWLIGNGWSIDVMSDTWLSNLPLAQWPTLVSMDDMVGGRVNDLFYPEERRWNIDLVTHSFGAQLTSRVLAMLVPMEEYLDVRVWRSTYGTKAPSRDLYKSIERSHPKDCKLLESRDYEYIWELAFFLKGGIWLLAY